MELKVQKRDVFGSAVSKLRAKGLVPAELYGHGIENLHLVVPTADFRRVYKEAGENQIVNIEVDGKKFPTLIHDVQLDPLKDEILTIDFYQVRMDEKIEAHVPIEVIGVSSAVKGGGILVKAMDEITVEALPGEIPAKIQVDISGLDEIGKSIYVRDLKISEKIKVQVSPNTVIVTISAPVSEEEEAAKIAEATAASVDKVAVESEEKKVARDAEKAAKEGPQAAAPGGAKPAASTPKKG